MGATIRTIALFMVLSLLFVIVGWAIGTFLVGDWVMITILFLAFSIGINVFSYFMSAKMVMWSYRAKIVQPEEAPRLHRSIQRVCQKANMPLPKIAIMQTATPNAFATGRNEKNAVVAATTGLLDILSDDELDGVLAHEMAHVKDKDILVMTIAATIVGAVSIAARMLFWSNLSGGNRRNNDSAWLMLIVAITIPIAALLIRLAISRSREYKADEKGAIFIQNPRSLANALAKLEQGNKRRPLDRGNPASASIFIVNPFRGAGMLSIFSTHPPIQQRIKRLEDLAREKGY